jgi:hypothetical protein
VRVSKDPQKVKIVKINRIKPELNRLQKVIEELLRDRGKLNILEAGYGLYSDVKEAT